MYTYTSTVFNKRLYKTRDYNKRLYENSSNEEVFNSVKQEYEMALKKSGYNSNLKYINQNKQRSTNKRSRNIIWFNPPFSQTVKTNVAKKFFHLLDKHLIKLTSYIKFLTETQ